MTPKRWDAAWENARKWNQPGLTMLVLALLELEDYLSQVCENSFRHQQVRRAQKAIHKMVVRDLQKNPDVAHSIIGL